MDHVGECRSWAVPANVCRVKDLVPGSFGPRRLIVALHLTKMKQDTDARAEFADGYRASGRSGRP